MVRIIIQRSIHEYRGSFFRKVPVKCSEPASAWMCFEIDPIKRLEPRPGEFRRISEAAFFVHLLPNEEDLVGSIQSIDFKFIIRVFSSDEEFHVVVIINRGIVGCEFRMKK